MFKKKISTIKIQIILCSFAIFTIALLTYIGNATHAFAILDNLGFNKDHNQQVSIPFLLPFNIHQSIPNHGGIQDPKTQTNTPSISPKIATSSTTNPFSCRSTNNLNDNFDSTYNLDGGQTSPNGKWQNVYNGFGSSGVEVADGSHVFFLKPKPATSPEDTQAALVQSTGTFCNYKLDFDIKTVKQLRENSPPNSWEAGWFIFRYTDTFHYYWFLIRSNGIELGKKDCDTCTNPVDGQQWLVTKDVPTLDLNTWHHWTINIVGNHIKIYVDGNIVVDFIDSGMTPQLSKGKIAMYSEEAYVRYDNMHLKSK